MENEFLIYVLGGIGITSGVIAVVSSYRFSKKLKEARKESSEEYKQQQMAMANKLEKILDSMPQEQRQQTIEVINMVQGGGLSDLGLHRFYVEPMISKYSAN